MYLTVKETAELIRVSERHTYKLIQNVIPHTKIGGKIINKEKLLNTLEKRRPKLCHM